MKNEIIKTDENEINKLFMEIKIWWNKAKIYYIKL